MAYDLFEKKGIKPMLIKEMQAPFNNPDWIFELKLDGVRCIAYIDYNNTDLRNKRNITLLTRFPELTNINLQVKERCILDGELIVLKNNVPDFYEVQRRTILTDKFKIQLAYNKLPASFVAYDILYYKNKSVVDLPLMERKKLLSDVLVENKSISVSRYIEEHGIELFELADKQKLEGIVAKRKDSKYYFDKRSKDWVKFKRMSDEEFVICGLVKKLPMSSLILGRYNNGKLVYKGSVSFGVRLNILSQYKFKTIPYSPFTHKVDDESSVIWYEPEFVCTIEYMPSTNSDSMRQPVFKGIRDDISIDDLK